MEIIITFGLLWKETFLSVRRPFHSPQGLTTRVCCGTHIKDSLFLLGSQTSFLETNSKELSTFMMNIFIVMYFLTRFNKRQLSFRISSTHYLLPANTISNNHVIVFSVSIDKWLTIKVITAADPYCCIGSSNFP